MTQNVIVIVSFLSGLGVLIAGAELLVRGAAKLALTLGLSPLVVGLTIVAYGTSSPEMAVAVQSSVSGQADIAVGNVIGSNIFNVLFILGVSAMIAPLIVDQQLVRQEVPIMAGASLLLAVLTWDGNLSRTEGLILTSLAIVYTAFLIIQSRRLREDIEKVLPMPSASSPSWDSKPTVQISLIVVGLALLLLGANLLVESAVTIAGYLGISEMVIGLTIVAAGTSLPEVATSIMAAVRGQRDIAVGNVVGSNIFNILAVLGLSAAVAPGPLLVAPAMVAFDIPVMLAVAVACLPVFFTGKLIARWEGVVFFGLYIAYATYLVLAAKQHDALSAYGFVLGLVVLPLYTFTIGIIAWREWHNQSQSS